MSQDARIAFRGLFALFPLLVSFTFSAAAAPAASDARVSETYGRLPLHFEANQGQTHKDVRFVARGPGYSLYLTPGEAVLVLARPNQNAKAEAKPVALHMSLVGAARKPLASGHEELPGKANYFIGKDPAKWRTNVPTYAKVHYREVYPGIDLVYYGNQRQLEYDFVVAPGADPNRIVLGFNGADKLKIDARGDLVLHARGGAIHQRRPVIYQKIDGARTEIDGAYVLKGSNRVGFKIAAYDVNRPLIIDPVVLSYSTYLGGGGSDFGNGIAVDAAGNAYIVGGTRQSDFPTTLGAFQPTPKGVGNAFVAKLNSTGSVLLYSTYLGGTNDQTAFSRPDFGSAIAVDSDGNAYVTGQAGSPDFPTTAGAFQTTRGGGTDGFVAKLDPTGSALVYSTRLGGIGNDQGSGIALDAGGNAYVTGGTNSTNFPTTAGAFQPIYGGGSFDSFVTKLDAAGAALVYSTYLGGSGEESLSKSGIAVDTTGNAYVSGPTSSTDFPTTAGAFQPVYGGGAFDAFVTKLDAAGSALVYSTYLGGSGDESRFEGGIAVDTSGNAYVVGSTSSTDFPTTAGAFQSTYGGGLSDAFVTKLDAAGGALVYSTYLGGSEAENQFFGGGIAVDTNGNAYVVGATSSTNFPTTVGAFQPVYGGGSSDAFVTKFNAAGSALVYSSFLGGNSGESVNGIAVDTAGNAYVTGSTISENFPTTVGAFDTTFGSPFPAPASPDGFVAKIVDLAPPSLPSATGPGTSRSEESAANQIGSWTTFGSETGTFSGGTIVASNTAASTAVLSFTGTAVNWIGVKCNVCGIAVVSIDGRAPTTANTAGPAAPGSLTSEVVFSASGLDPALTHTMVITVTGTTNSGGAYIAVDAFDITGGSATSPLLPSLALPPPPLVAPALPSPL